MGMPKFRKGSGGPWLAAGIVAGILLAPAAAIGAAGLVGIVGSNGKRAQVTPANQLQTAPASPGSYRSKWTPGISNAPCTVVFAAPAKKGLVVTRMQANTWTNPTPGAANFVTLYRDAVCTSSTTTIVARINPPGFGIQTVEFDPGFALKAGKKLYANTQGGVITDLTMTGYLVPKKAVPSTTPARVPAGTGGNVTQG
jgi:hypothetical protein